MKVWIDGFIRFVSVYVIIVFIYLFNCVDGNMQPKIEMVFIQTPFGPNFIHFYKKRIIMPENWNKAFLQIRSKWRGFNKQLTVIKHSRHILIDFSRDCRKFGLFVWYLDLRYARQLFICKVEKYFSFESRKKRRNVPDRLCPLNIFTIYGAASFSNLALQLVNP